MIKVYISSPVSFYQREWNLAVTNNLRNNGVQVFLPQDISSKGIRHIKFEKYVYEQCIDMIQKSDLGLLLFPYGRDCAWEAGYYKGLNKPFIIFVSKMNIDQIDRLRDWMVKGAITAVITDNVDSYNALKSDLILQRKEIYLINSLSYLADKLENLLNNKYKSIPYTFFGAGVVVEYEDQILMVEEKEDSEYYYRRRGMIGFPTITVNSSEDPITAARRSLKEELKHSIEGDLEFVSVQNIPNAVGIFYKAKIKNKFKIPKNAKWYSKVDLLNNELDLRPTYENVLRVV